MGNACHEEKHWTLQTQGHLPDWAPPRPRKGPAVPSSAPLYPVRLLFIPGPEVWGFQYGGHGLAALASMTRV